MAKLYNRLIVGLLLFHFISNLLWILVNNAPFPWDQSSHAGIVITITEHLRSFRFLSILKASSYYPVFVHSIGAVFMYIFGPHLKLTQVVGTLFLVSTIAIIYLYFDLVFKNKKIAFLTAFFFSFFPIVYSFSKWLMLDVPLVGLFFLTLYFWEKSNVMANKKYALLTFFSAALIMITKWTGGLFLIVPFIITLYGIFKTPQKRNILVNCIFGVTIFLIVVLPWYITNFKSFLFQSKINVIGEQGADPQSLLSVENFTRYINDFINSQTTFYFAIPFFIIFAVLLFKKWERKYYILGMIVINYLIFTFISNKDGRYTIPILPFAAFVVAYGLEKIKVFGKALSNIVIILLISILFVYYLILTIRLTTLEGKYISFEIPKIQRFDLININDSLIKKYNTSTWSIWEILTDLDNLSQGIPKKVAIGIEHEHLNPSNLNTYLQLMQYGGSLANISMTTPDIYFLRSSFNRDSFNSNRDIEAYLKNVDYVLMSPESLGTPYLRNFDALVMLRNFVIHDSFIFCDTYISKVAPPGSVCYVDSGEILETDSDVAVNEKETVRGRKTINGFSKVTCSYGCSFVKKRQAEDLEYPKINIAKSYVLPDGLTVNLYKIR